MDKARQRLSGAQWMQHVSSWGESGLTQSAYCRVHGLALGTFNAWVGRVKRASVEAPASLTMVPVVVKAAVDPTQIIFPMSLQHHSGWRLHLPSGADANWLGNVLNELA